MDSVIRAFCVYVFLLLVLRISGKRTLSNMTPFDFVLVLILSETVQQAMIDDDNSMTNSFLLVLTLIGLDVLLSLIKEKSPRFARLMDSTPVVIMQDGELKRDRMKAERVEDDDVLSAARKQEGIGRLDEIDYAVVEQNGDITIVPKN
jgi:uncharacterized membrane protein YcaP (DUF421 family)